MQRNNIYRFTWFLLLLMYNLLQANGTQQQFTSLLESLLPLYITSSFIFNMSYSRGSFIFHIRTEQTQVLIVYKMKINALYPCLNNFSKQH
jgi:hypothetical protein